MWGAEHQLSMFFTSLLPFLTSNAHNCTNTFNHTFASWHTISIKWDTAPDFSLFFLFWMYKAVYWSIVCKQLETSLWMILSKGIVYCNIVYKHWKQSEWSLFELFFLSLHSLSHFPIALRPSMCRYIFMDRIFLCCWIYSIFLNGLSFACLIDIYPYIKIIKIIANTSFLKTHSGNSLVVQRLALSALTAGPWVWYLVGKLRSCKLYGGAKKKKKKTHGDDRCDIHCCGSGLYTFLAG